MTLRLCAAEVVLPFYASAGYLQCSLQRGIMFSPCLPRCRIVICNHTVLKNTFR